MIVVDSSVWIASMRKLDTEPVRRLRSVVEDNKNQVIVGDLILLEVLQGARDAVHADRLEAALRQFSIRPMLDATLAIRAAANFRLLRRHGITIRTTIDMIIGTFCIEHDCLLLHDDRDFEPMRRHLGLKTI